VEEYGVLLATTGGKRRIRGYLESKGHPGDLDELAESLHRLKNELFVRWIAEGETLRARPGVSRLLAGLKMAGVKTAVASTGSRRWVDPLLERLFPQVFDVVITGDDVTKLKPDPQAYHLALERLGVEPQEAIAVEDSPPGLAAALAAGLGTVVVSSAYNRRAAFPGALVVLEEFDCRPQEGQAPDFLERGLDAESLRLLHRAAADAR